MNKISVLYWCPFISKVATIKAVINSVFGLLKYSNQKYEPEVINVFGEWNDFKDELKLKKIRLTSQLINLNFLKSQKGGYLISRLKYSLIFFFSLFPLIKLLKQKNSSFIIVHLVTSLPLFVFSILNFKTKLILRISGLPKLNFFRKLLWKLSVKNIYKITCPTQETYDNLSKIPHLKEKLIILRDPILSIAEINKKKKKELDENLPKGDFILSIGRLTKQKNFSFLLKVFSKLKLENLSLVIIGKGELKKDLIKQSKQLNIEKKIFFINETDNVFNIIEKSKYFVLTSLWEDPGFVLIEAAVMNKIIVSSNCPSGPKEILNNGLSGFLFNSNDENSFLKAFKELQNSSEKELKNKMINAKIMTKEFTLFRHYKMINKVLS
ncbi:MAG: hypothetical protein CBC25_00210 [Pelagibacteraceae bacterium TMED65]|nr:MAG: hypothetical protein CBC25_00210 [Pelagibacteraceae bacterium TMED65]|tara:strand:+ start:773 stop:1915 length:1143 start_codon:yes stop_codon:yes gene_type:complete